MTESGCRLTAGQCVWSLGLGTDSARRERGKSFSMVNAPIGRPANPPIIRDRPPEPNRLNRCYENEAPGLDVDGPDGVFTASWANVRAEVIAWNLAGSFVEHPLLVLKQWM